MPFLDNSFVSGHSRRGRYKPLGKARRGEKVRILLTFSMNPEKGDQLIKEGRIGEAMEPILEDLQPEAAYFTDVEGTRGGFLVVNMEDASQIPAMTEPLLLGLGATVHMQPVMTPEDLRGAAGEALQHMAQKYG
jgi:hypothetical protein